MAYKKVYNPRVYVRRYGSIKLLLLFSETMTLCLEYGDGAESTIEENSSIFSLMQVVLYNGLKTVVVHGVS